MSRLLAGTVDQVQVERMIRGTNGRPVQVLAHASALTDPSGQRIGAVAYLHDLTALRDVEQRRQQQEDFFLALSQRASDLVIVIDALGQVLYTSPALTGSLGHEPIDVLSEDVLDFIHPDDRATTTSLLEDVVRGAEASTTLRIRDAAGGWRWFEAALEPARHRGRRRRVQPARRHRADHRRAGAARLRGPATAPSPTAPTRGCGWPAPTAARCTSTPGCATSSASTPTRCTPSRSATSSPSAREGPGTSRVPPAGSAPSATRRRTPTPTGGCGMLRIAAAPLEVGEGEDDQAAYLAMVTDITESRRLERELRQAALHDHLTGLPNRALLLDRLEHALTRETRSTAVLFVDLDQFKIINDARGHTVGDQLLVAVADRLRASVRPFDTVARFGGDEFLVICENVDEEHSHLIATDLLLALDEPFPVAPACLHVAATIGIALSPSPSAEHLLRNAETAMYAAKQAGPPRHPALRRLAGRAGPGALRARRRPARGAARRRARHALPADRRAGRRRGRRRRGPRALGPPDPRRGAAGPLPVALAERTGISRSLIAGPCAGRCARPAGCATLGAPPPTAYVAVNLSPRHLADAGLEEHLDSCTRAAGLPPARDARDHRAGDHGRAGAGHRAAAPAARAGLPGGDGRLRHRLQALALAPARAPGLHAQDRPQLRGPTSAGDLMTRARSRPRSWTSPARSG